MRDNWICVEGRWLNLDAIRDIYVKRCYDPEKNSDFYIIAFSCNPYERNINYERIGPIFDSEKEAQEYLDKLLTGDEE